eukprot:gnl/MRDRNA2_/MRDRNA2_166019_c0_seq1.p1 gnl/MRDRNA2_/MRDRNA2_166019_c0~~gnl/MRDRNA2_/MRDRNA2_166019_c0_seq1.p1  ORF type:complete len:151 (-),score=36.35 gnl/MRDRNA2_/MRDRNA2_166019_c0_seq1:19-471(-)
MSTFISEDPRYQRDYDSHEDGWEEKQPTWNGVRVEGIPTNIICELPDGGSCSIECSVWSTVIEVKKIIEAEAGIPAKTQKLIDPRHLARQVIAGNAGNYPQDFNETGELDDDTDLGMYNIQGGWHELKVEVRTAAEIRALDDPDWKKNLK